MSADKTSVVSAGKTPVVSAEKTSVVSADKASVVSQDIPVLWREVLSADTAGLGKCKVDLLGTIFESLDLLEVDLLGNDFGRS